MREQAFLKCPISTVLDRRLDFRYNIDSNLCKPPVPDDDRLLPMTSLSMLTPGRPPCGLFPTDAIIERVYLAYIAFIFWIWVCFAVSCEICGPSSAAAFGCQVNESYPGPRILGQSVYYWNDHFTAIFGTLSYPWNSCKVPADLIKATSALAESHLPASRRPALTA
jgi:hypothetical protein